MRKLNRRDFGKRFGIGITALSVFSSGAASIALATPAAAGAAPDRLADGDLVNFSFGEAVNPEMVCTRGACRNEKMEVDVSRYKLPVDLSFFGGVEIGTPMYDYHANQLMRIVFTVSDKNPNADLNAILAVFKRQYGLTLQKKSHRVFSAGHEVRIDRYITDQGQIIEIDKRKRHGIWLDPVVKYFDKILLDEFNLSAEPNYLPD